MFPTEEVITRKSFLPANMNTQVQLLDKLEPGDRPTTARRRFTVTALEEVEPAGRPDFAYRSQRIFL